VSATLDIPYAVGDSVWWAHVKWDDTREPCPTCFGDKCVTLILGNGEQVSIECTTCEDGWHDACGWVTKPGREAVVERVTLMSVQVYGGDVIYITLGTLSVGAEELFADEDAARTYAARLAEKQQRDEEERMAQVIASKRKKASWTAGYCRSQITRLEKELAVARGRLAVAKAPRAEVPS